MNEKAYQYQEVMRLSNFTLFTEAPILSIQRNPNVIAIVQFSCSISFVQQIMLRGNPEYDEDPLAEMDCQAFG